MEEHVVNASFGGICALSRVVSLSNENVDTKLVLAGMCSRILVWDLLRGRVVGSCMAMPHGIRVHGISLSQCGVDEYHVVAHGGRCLTLMYMKSSSGGTKVDISVVEHVRGIEKWILDVASCLVEGQGLLCVAVGKIDNSVSLYCYCDDGDGSSKMRRIKDCVGDARCLLYSMSIRMVHHIDGDDVYEWRVAAGTILWDVVVWSIRVNLSSLLPNSEKDEMDCAVHQYNVHGFTGHQGSIHTVAWSTDGSMLASGSDDRIVKVWRMDQEEDDICIDLVGSGSRIWALCFSCDDSHVWSGAEDGCIYCWDISSCSRGDSHKVHTKFKAHAFRGVWNLVMHQDMLISGGADGGLKVWNTFDHVPHDRASQWAGIELGAGDLHQRLDTYLIPAFLGEEDAVVARFQMTTGDRLPLHLLDDRLERCLARADGMRKQALTKNRFETIKVICIGDDGQVVYVGTDAGRVLAFYMSSDTRSNMYRKSKDSLDTEGCVLYENHLGKPIISLECHGSLLTFCDVNGRVHVVEVVRNGGSFMTNGPVQEAEYTCTSHIVYAFFVEMQRTPHVLCTTTQGTIFLFKVDEGIPCLVSQIDCPNKARITAVSVRDSHLGSLVILGSSKGGISGFIVTRGHVLAVAVQRFAHDRTPVQYVHIEHLHDNAFHVETGACNFSIQHYNVYCNNAGVVMIEMKNEQRFEPLKVICGRIASRDMLIGFYTNYFAIWDVDLSSEFCSIYCPSWRRPWDIHYDASRSIVMFCYSSGVGDLHVFRRKLSRKGCATSPRILGTSSHGREINSVVDLGDRTLVTAAEDATLRVCRWVRDTGGIILHSKCFSTQPLGTTVRMMQVIQVCEGKTLMVTGGAKTVLTAWTYSSGEQKPFHLSTFVDTNALKSGNKREKTDFGDIRVTSLCLMQADTECAQAVVVAAHSNSLVEVRYIPKILQGNSSFHEWPLIGILTAPANMVRPTILSLIHIGGSTVCGGDTNGNLLFWNIHTKAHDDPALIHPVAIYREIHSSGVNCMALMRQNPTHTWLITGGDDQRLCISQLDLMPESLTLSATQSISNAHASAIRDICVLKEDCIISVGLDQYLRVWRPDAQTPGSPPSFSEIHSRHVQVLEPYCMTSAPAGSNSTSITVAGRGIETISLVEL